MNKIILTAESDLKDNELREWFSIMQRQIETLKDRTKKHTKLIKELEKKLKK